jgi:hypothetical protein
MTQRYLVTLNVGREFLGENARRSFRAAARRWGAQYLEILTPSHPGEPLLDKLCLPEFLPEAGRFAFFDADVLIRADCPSLFDVVPEGHFGAALSHQPGHDLLDAHILPTLPPWLDRHGILGLDPIEDYLNTGVLVFDRPAHDAVFRTAIGSGWERGGWVITDQAMLSAAVHLRGVPLFRLAPQFNRCGDAIWRRWTPGMRDFVWHFCGYSERKWRIDHTNWYDLGPDREEEGVVIWRDGRPATGLGRDEVAFLLRELCHLRPGARLVEVDAGLGGLTSYVLPFVRDLGGTLRSVDTWTDPSDSTEAPGLGERIHRGFLRNMEDLGAAPPLHTWSRARSAEAAPEEPDESLDMVVIGGASSLGLEALDVAAWWPKLRPGGVLLGRADEDHGPDLADVAGALGGEVERGLGSRTLWKATRPRERVVSDRPAPDAGRPGCRPDPPGDIPPSRPAH